MKNKIDSAIEQTMNDNPMSFQNRLEKAETPDDIFNLLREHHPEHSSVSSENTSVSAEMSIDAQTENEVFAELKKSYDPSRYERNLPEKETIQNGGNFRGAGASGSWNEDIPDTSKPFNIVFDKEEPKYTTSILNNLYEDTKAAAGDMKELVNRGGESFLGALSGFAESISGSENLKDWNDSLRSYKAMEEKGDERTSEHMVASALYGFSRMAPQLLTTLGAGVLTGGAAAPIIISSMQGAGDLYKDMDDEGIDENISLPVSLIGGTIYGAIENIQIGQAVPGYKNLTAGVKKVITGTLTDTVKKIATKEGLKKAGKFALTVGKEVSEEVVQEMSNVAFDNIGRGINDLLKGSKLLEDAPGLSEQINRYVNTAKESVGPLLVASLLGHGGTAIAEHAAGKMNRKLDDIPKVSADTIENVQQPQPIVPPVSDQLARRSSPSKDGSEMSAQSDLEQTQTEAELLKVKPENVPSDAIVSKSPDGGIYFVWPELNNDGRTKTWVAQRPDMDAPVAMLPDRIAALGLKPADIHGINEDTLRAADYIGLAPDEMIQVMEYMQTDSPVPFVNFAEELGQKKYNEFLASPENVKKAALDKYMRDNFEEQPGTAAETTPPSEHIGDVTDMALNNNETPSPVEGARSDIDNETSSPPLPPPQAELSGSRSDFNNEASPRFVPGQKLVWNPRKNSRWVVSVIGDPLPDGTVEIKVEKSPQKKNIGETHIIAPEKLYQLSEPQGVQTRKEYQKQLSGFSKETRGQIKKDASEFDSLVKASDVFFDIFDSADKSKTGQDKQDDAVTEFNALKQSRIKAAEYLGIKDGDINSPMDRAKHLDALKEWLNGPGKKLETAKKSELSKKLVEKAKTEKIFAADLQDGDQVFHKGEWMISSVDDSTGDILLLDGTKITLDPADEINVAGGEIISPDGEVRKPEDDTAVEDFDPSVPSDLSVSSVPSLFKEPVDNSFFENPDRDRELKNLPDETLRQLNKPQKPLVLKKNIVEKNNEHHPELALEDNQLILNEALYQTTELFQGKPKEKPDYWVFVKKNGKSKLAVVELSESKDNYEIVGWRYSDLKGLDNIKNRAGTEGGQFLITKGDETQRAADLSALRPSSDKFKSIPPENPASDGNLTGRANGDNIPGIDNIIPQPTEKVKGTSLNASIDQGYQNLPDLPRRSPTDEAGPPALELPELVRLATELLGEAPQIRKNMGNKLGFFKGKGEEGFIALSYDIFAGPRVDSVKVKKDDRSDARKKLIAENAKKFSVPETEIIVNEFYDRKTRRFVLTAHKRDHAYPGRTIAHEIGHSGDWLPDKTLKRGNIFGHIAALNGYFAHMLSFHPDTPNISDWDKKQMRIQAALAFELPGDAYGDEQAFRMRRNFIKERTEALIEERNIKTRTEIMDELKALSEWWTPFPANPSPGYVKYRNRPSELYADAVSVLLNAPKELQKRAPGFYTLFQNYAIKRPEVKKSLDGIYNDINSGKIKETRVKALLDGFDEGEKRWIESVKKEDPKLKDALNDMKTLFYDRFSMLEKYVEAARQKGLPEDVDPYYAAEEYSYAAGKHEVYMGRVNEGILEPLKKNGVEWKTFGEYLFHRRVVNERTDKANPEGFTSETSGERLDEMRTNMGGKFAVMEKAASEFWKIRKEEVIKLMKENNMFSEELMKKIDSNEHYAAFDVNKYIEKEHGQGSGAKIYQQIGTLEHIRNPATATMAKDLQLIRSVMWNRTKKLTADMLQKFDPSLIEKADDRFVNDHKEYLPVKTNEKGTMFFMEDGKIKAFYINRKLADVFERENYQVMNFYLKGLVSSGDFFRTVFTQIKPGFTVANFIRDTWRTGKHLRTEDKTLYGAFIHPSIRLPVEIFRAMPHAWKSTENKLTPLISEMLQKSMLISVADLRNLNNLETQIERMTAMWNVTARERFNNMPAYKKMASMFVWYSIRAGKTVERIPKIAAYTYLKQYRPDLSEKQIAHQIRTIFGSPDFLKRGTQSHWTNAIAIFSNAIVQGYASDWKAMKNDETVMMKTVIGAIPYRSLLWTWKYGWIAAIAAYLFGDDDDRTEFFRKIQSVLEKIPEYDLMNYAVIPVGETEHGQALYIRIPQDETTKLISGITWNAMNIYKGTFSPGDVPKIFNYAADQLPGFNPVFTLVSGSAAYLGLKEELAPNSLKRQMGQTLWNARGQDGVRLQGASEFGKWAWNTSGGSYFWKFPAEAQKEAPKEDGFAGMVQTASTWPIVNDIVGRFLKVSDAGIAGEIKKEILDPMRNEQAAISVMKKNIVEKRLKDGDLSNLTDEERAIYVRNRKQIMNMVRDAMKLRGSDAETRAVLKANSKKEKQAVQNYLIK
ncbi:MAG: hypothetical protein A2017_06645 [Lentisphaerae bacterium GWF2_44_16]|nr:MAG: hypothetical protein A2017_06645 [Lentisphaerae bacterium GWF2_44_16]